MSSTRLYHCEPRGAGSGCLARTTLARTCTGVPVELQEES